MSPLAAVREKCRAIFKPAGFGLLLITLLSTVNAAVYADAGASSYSGRCAACHQPDGKGVDGRFPPLKQALSSWLATPQGRSYLVRAVLYGPVGELKVDGKTYSSIMPAMGRRMNDDEIVAVLRYVGETLNTPPAGYQPFDPALVASLRSSPTAEDTMMADRGKLPPR